MHSAQIDYHHRPAAPARPSWRPSPRLLVWLLFLIGCAAVTFAGVASLHGCASDTQADVVLDAAAVRVAELKDAEKAATERNDAKAARAAQARRQQIEAAAAAVAGAKAAKAAPEETAAAAAAAGLVGGPAAAAITAALALVGHLWRTSQLRESLTNLRQTLAEDETATADIVNSIENAKDTHPEFADAFEKAAPTIRARQNARARRIVDEVAGSRQIIRRGRRGISGIRSVTPVPPPSSSAPAPSA